jgi:hypothetical protein
MMVVFVLLVLLSLSASESSNKAIVVTNVADLMGTPQGRPLPVEFHHDANQMTQLLYMEPVRVLQWGATWTQVEALEQPMVYNGTWGGYQGYVLTSQLCAVSQYPKPTHSVIVQYTHLFPDTPDFPITGYLPNQLLLDVSFGTWLEAVGDEVSGWLPVTVHGTYCGAANVTSGWILAKHVAEFVPSEQEETVRSLLASRAHELLGFLYFWGGRSAFNFPLFNKGTQLTGLDCSGLCSILYRSLGIIIPRDASKQAMKSYNNITSTSLKVGDLFYLGMPFSSTDHVTHVMMLHALEPEPLLVESAGNSTRILPITRVFGAPLEKLIWGQKLSEGRDAGATLTWGTWYPPQKEYQ